MPRRPETSREAILAAAMAIARERGLAKLGIRSVAASCGVSVGTIYNYFPDKDALVTGVVGSFWHDVLDPWLSHATSLGLVEACEELATCLAGPLSEFRGSWLGESGPRRPSERGEAARGESDLIGKVVGTLEAAALDDPRIDQDGLSRVGTHELAVICWHEVRDASREGATSCQALTTLIELALYRQRHDASC